MDPDTLCHDCLRNDDILRQHPLAMAILLEELLHRKTAKPVSPAALQTIHRLNLVMKGTAFRLIIKIPTPGLEFLHHFNQTLDLIHKYTNTMIKIYNKYIHSLNMITTGACKKHEQSISYPIIMYRIWGR